MAHQEEAEIFILKTRELLSKAHLLLKDIEELLDWCTPKGPISQRQHRPVQQECEACIEENGETLVIDGFRFESAANRDELRSLSSQADAGGQQMTVDYLSSFTTQGQQGQTSHRGTRRKSRSKKKT